MQAINHISDSRLEANPIAVHTVSKLHTKPGVARRWRKSYEASVFRHMAGYRKMVESKSDQNDTLMQTKDLHHMLPSNLSSEQRLHVQKVVSTNACS